MNVIVGFWNVQIVFENFRCVGLRSAVVCERVPAASCFPPLRGWRETSPSGTHAQNTC